MLCLPDDTLLRLLTEDAPHGDLTTAALEIGPRPGTMTFLARAPMTVCCIEEAARLCILAGCTDVRRLSASGEAVSAGAPLLVAEGPAESLHLAWKVAQTLVEITSGIASATRAMVTAARSVHPAAVVATTRKTFPGTRALAFKAVRAGGGVAHRLGLSETVLVFAEHRAFLSEAERLVHMDTLKARCPEKRVVAEVTTRDQAHQAVKGGVDILQLERFSPEEVAALAGWLAATDLDRRVTLAAAGGVTPANAADYVRAGARILVTSAPYYAPPCNVKVVIDRKSDPLTP